MKKIIVLIVMLFSAATIAQSVGWTDLMETNITVGNNNYDIFTNRYGNHIIVQETSSLKYYRMDVEGNTVSSTDLETSAVVSPSISGDATRIYVVYRKSTENYIRTKYSTDGGSSWSYLSNSPTNSNGSSIECVFSKNKLHVTWEISDVVYFSYYNTVSESWLSTQTVSGTYTATDPRIGVWNAGTEDKVYFIYQSNNYIRWREYDLDGSSWSNVIWFIGYGLGFDPLHLGFVVDDTYICAFDKPSNTSILGWTLKETANNAGFPSGGNSNGNTYVDKIFSTTTANGKPYTAAWSTLENYPDRIVRMEFVSSSVLVYDVIHTETGLTPVNIVNLSSAENDVHVVWKDNLGTNNGNNLRYKYYDDIPLVPQDLDVEIYTVGLRTHPKLTWTRNNAPDVYFYSNGYNVWRRISINGGPWGSWSSIGYSDGKDSEYLDETIGSCYAEAHTAEYKIRAVDINDNVSEFSEVVSINFSAFYKLSHSMVQHNYELKQNYPNPFNPSTQISYSLAQDAFVTLKVYDMLGNEIAELVNLNQTAGNYETNFNAVNLSSGIYIYRITAINDERILFSESKRMILMK